MIAWLSKRSFNQLLQFGIIVFFAIILLYQAAVMTPAVFFLFLFAAFLMTVRLRFRLNPVTAWIDIILVIVIGFFNIGILWFLLPIVFYVVSHGKFASLLPLIVVVIHLEHLNLSWIAMLIFAILIGLIMLVFNAKYTLLLKDNDGLRKKGLDLEKTHNQLIQEVAETEMLAAINERQKIAEKLHDDLGHELTAAHLALKAYNHLRTTDSKKAETFLTQTNERLDLSLTRLKDTVQNTEPMQVYGIDRFKKQLSSVPELPINFKSHGLIQNIPTYVWQLLHTTLKESLTNILKHAKPSYVNVVLESTAYIVRLKIENDGMIKTFTGYGHGLTYMRKRYQAMQGSISVQTDDPFTIIAVIPLRRQS